MTTSNQRAIGLIVLGLTSFLLILLVGYRAVQKGKRSSADQQLMAKRAQETTASYYGVSTRVLNVEEYIQLIRAQIKANSNGLSENQSEKLARRIEQFYRCYSTGDFEMYKRFRLHGSYSIGERLAAAVKKKAAEKGVVIVSDEDLLRLAWDVYNGTNRIAEVDPSSIVLAISNRHDLQAQLRQPSIAGPGTNFTANCWQGAVRYASDPEVLLKEKGAILVATVDQFVRFNDVTAGPSTPLRLILFWEPEQEDWMPYSLCRVVSVGSYSTVF